MARIRTIKPEFFRHEGLQDLEAANPGCFVMLVFAGLWGNCDKAGRFEWKPRTLKLDILPFLDFDLGDTLAILARAGFVRRYVHDGKQYGEVVNFEKHQRIGGKEAQESAKHPEPTDYEQGSTGEAPGKQRGLQEGKGKEREKEGNGKERASRASSPSAPPDVSPQVWSDFLQIRKQKRAPLTDTALTAIREEAGRAGITLEDALRVCCKRGWQGFEASWLKGKDGKQGNVEEARRLLGFGGGFNA